MDLNRMFKTLRNHPDSAGMGMIATHVGIVRGHSLDGKKVKGIEVEFDHNVLEEIINDIKSMDGIVDVTVETHPGRLEVGDEIMAVAVGGDTREHVFPALIRAVDRIKRECTTKREFYR